MVYFPSLHREHPTLCRVNPFICAISRVVYFESLYLSVAHLLHSWPIEVSFEPLLLGFISLYLILILQE